MQINEKVKPKCVIMQQMNIGLLCMYASGCIQFNYVCTCISAYATRMKLSRLASQFSNLTLRIP